MQFAYKPEAQASDMHDLLAQRGCKSTAREPPGGMDLLSILFGKKIDSEKWGADSCEFFCRPFFCQTP